MAAASGSRVLTVPNVLSLARLATIPVFVGLVVAGAMVAAALVFAALAATDWLDGHLARRLGQVSRLGELLDPMTDRFAILAALTTLAVVEVIPWWFAVAVLGRDAVLIAMVPLLRRQGRHTLPVHRLGKVATALLLVAFPLLLIAAESADAGAGASAADLVAWTFAGCGLVGYWAAGALYVRQTLAVPGSVGTQGAERPESPESPERSAT